MSVRAYGVRRGHWISWFVVSHLTQVLGELNSDPLQEQRMLLTTELQPLGYFCLEERELLIGK